jgi:hypothetical protein
MRPVQDRLKPRGRQLKQFVLDSRTRFHFRKSTYAAEILGGHNAHIELPIGTFSAPPGPWLIDQVARRRR